MRTTFVLDKGWKYCALNEELPENSHNVHYSMSKSGGCIGPASRSYDDSHWKSIDIPHDYLVATEFSPNASLSHGYKERENFWYRKTFTMDKAYSKKHFLLCFEGISVFSEIYFNGSLIERSFSAYCEIPVDVTDRMHFGSKPNTIAVHIDAHSQEGWWYEGAGIYRHVSLFVKEPLHIAHNGLWIKPVLKKGTENDWTVECETTVENSLYDDKAFETRITIFDKNGNEVSCAAATASCGENSTCAVLLSADVCSPERWDVENPVLYHAKAELFENGVKIDEAEESFGFRTFYIDAEKGFFLNERNIKILGTCNHQDHAGVGVAVPDSVQYYRIKRLKDMGTNAYRCSHNMPSRAILDACDRLGMIVMDENRRFETSTDVMNQLRTLIKRDRNHPSVIFYSLFNEENFVQNNSEGKRIFMRMKSEVKKLDDTRLILGAVNGINSPDEGTALQMDVTGFNYDIASIPSFHSMFPNQPVIGTENNSAVSTRGCYKTDMDAHELSAYDDNTVPWGQTIKETWKFVRDNDYMSGIFIWTGFDYRGEPTPFEYPSISSQFGIMDTCGFGKDSFYYNKACFTSEPMMHILPHWNHKSGEVIRVETVTNCEEAELILNGKTLGRKKSDVCEQCSWLVDYEPGTLTAIGYNDGAQAVRESIETTGVPKRICLMPFSDTIKDDGADTVVVNVCVLDDAGRIVPDASNLISFTLYGDGRVLGVGNGNPNSHESDVLPLRRLYNGYCQVLVQTELDAQALKLVASSEDLESAQLEFKIDKVSKPLYIFNTEGKIISNWTMSVDTYSEKPDPLMQIADNDMNSFESIELEYGFQNFTSGYKMFRACFELSNSSKKEYKLNFPAVSAAEFELYINGKLVLHEDNPEYEKPIETSFAEFSDKHNEIRIIIKAIEGKKSGLKYDIEISE